MTYIEDEEMREEVI